MSQVPSFFQLFPYHLPAELLASLSYQDILISNTESLKMGFLWLHHTKPTLFQLFQIPRAIQGTSWNLQPVFNYFWLHFLLRVFFWQYFFLDFFASSSILNCVIFFKKDKIVSHFYPIERKAWGYRHLVYQWWNDFHLEEDKSSLSDAPQSKITVCNETVNSGLWIMCNEEYD